MDIASKQIQLVIYLFSKTQPHLDDNLHPRFPLFRDCSHIENNTSIDETKKIANTPKIAYADIGLLFQNASTNQSS